MKRRNPAAIIAASMCPLALLAGACASSSAPENAPAWYAETISDSDAPFPTLRDVPEVSVTNNDPAYWAAVATEMRAALEELRADPRANFGQTEDADAFLDEARREIEATRDAH